MSVLRRGSAPLSAWFARWRPILPLLVAEFVVWLGFGALLPIMSLYFRDNGVDLATLGIVIAAWPATRLIGEPIFGWLADRYPRVPLMVAGNIGAGIFQFLPLLLIGAWQFTILRALQGLSTSVYDPAARGYITDATPRERRGEAFGLYGAAQMGGLFLGPAIGGVGAAVFDGLAFVFILGGVSSFLAAIAIAAFVREVPAGGRRHPPTFDAAEFPGRPLMLDDGSADEAADPAAGDQPVGERIGLVNRLLVSAVLVTIGANFASGAYDVIWGIFLDDLGAGIELIGLTFAMFGLPALVLTPFFGRRVDRGHLRRYVIVGGMTPVVAGILYTLIDDPLLAVPLIIFEATGFAMLSPALYALVAAGSPPGRSSTAQGLYGASGTIGFILAALVTGVLAEADIRYPFYAFSAVMLAALSAGLAVGGARLNLVGRRHAPEPTETAVD